jgi:hypothetical protein
MDQSPHSYVTIDEILSDVLKSVNDASFKKNSKGWYTSQAQQALEELAFDTYFREENRAFNVPENLRLELPSGAFNIREMYLFNGDECNINNSAVVYHKKNFINGTSGNGYVARDTYKNARDPFHTKRGNRLDRIPGIQNGRSDRFSTGSGLTNEVYYFSVQNGLIMLSSSSKNYQKVMIVYNSVGTEIGEAPIIPSFLRQAVKDYVTVKSLESIMAMDDEKFNKWNALYGIHKNNLGDGDFNGSWAQGKRRVKRINTKERNDIKEYMSKLNY